MATVVINVEKHKKKERLVARVRHFFESFKPFWQQCIILLKTSQQKFFTINFDKLFFYVQTVHYGNFIAITITYKKISYHLNFSIQIFNKSLYSKRFC